MRYCPSTKKSNRKGLLVSGLIHEGKVFSCSNGILCLVRIALIFSSPCDNLIQPQDCVLLSPRSKALLLTDIILPHSHLHSQYLTSGVDFSSSSPITVNKPVL